MLGSPKPIPEHSHRTRFLTHDSRSHEDHLPLKARTAHVGGPCPWPEVILEKS